MPKWYCKWVGQVVIEAETREEAAELFYEGVVDHRYGVPIAMTEEEAARAVH